MLGRIGMSRKIFEDSMKTEAGFPQPNQIHIYYGSSFNSNEKWVCKGYEELYGFFPTCDAATERAREIAKTFLFPQMICVFRWWGGVRKRVKIIVTR